MSAEPWSKVAYSPDIGWRLVWQQGLTFSRDGSMVADCIEYCLQNLQVISNQQWCWSSQAALHDLYIMLGENLSLNLVEICQLIYEVTDSSLPRMLLCDIMSDCNIIHSRYAGPTSASFPDSLLKNGGRRGPGNILEKKLWTSSLSSFMWPRLDTPNLVVIVNKLPWNISTIPGSSTNYLQSRSLSSRHPELCYISSVTHYCICKLRAAMHGEQVSRVNQVQWTSILGFLDLCPFHTSENCSKCHMYT